MRADLIAAKDLSERDLACWRELAASAIEPNPFFEPEYLLPLARGLGAEGEMHLLVVKDADQWHACIPVHLTSHWRHIPVRSLATWRGHVLYGLLGTPLISPRRFHEALSALLDGLPGSAPGARFAALEWVSDDGPLGRELDGLLEERGPKPIRFERFERAALKRRQQPTYIEETLSAKHRRELRRQRRKLGEALGEIPETVDRAGQGAAYKEFVALEAASKGGQAKSVLAVDPGHVAFFEEMCQGFAAQGRLQMLCLQANGQTLAMKCNLLAGSTIFYFKIAYDERWSSYSPGILLELDMIERFHQKPELELMDSCADPNNVMINRLWPDRRPITTYLLPAQNATGRILRPALGTARALRDYRSTRRNR